MSEGIERYVVERKNWRRAGEDWVRLPGRIEVAAFGNVEEAWVDYRFREANARTLVGNPFRCGQSLGHLSSFPEFMFLDWLLDEGIEPPDFANGGRDWKAWFDWMKTRLSLDQQTHLWNGLDKIRFFDVRAETIRSKAWVLVEINWSNGGWRRVAGLPGGIPIRAFFKGVRAESVRHGFEFATCSQHEDLDPHQDLSFDDSIRRVATADPFSNVPLATQDRLLPPSDAPFFETAEVTVFADVFAFNRAKRLYLVVEKSLSFITETDPWSRRNQTAFWHIDLERPTGFSVAAYLTKDEARAEAWRREAESHVFLNPFLFAPPSQLTSLSEWGFRAVLAHSGLVAKSPPSEGWVSERREPVQAWANWWDMARTEMSEDTLDRVWAVIDQLRFYEVVEVPLVR